ncbi:lysozyme inhibitor LprI family protein [Desulfocurvus vexinensis]|uniref:lysozyme inhibitor LprI family protein n=1 Tax=Desulfocurvus vexinensis TaxID=399548 RepID=UPI00146FB666|nr:lysozyme inhibitor LprI family protein [Desulfocurvus vexinensis]
MAVLVPASAGAGGVECGANLGPQDRVHCENLLLDAADAELNRVYREALAALDSRGADLLRTAQRAWLAYRDNNFEAFSAADPAQGLGGLADRVRDLRLQTKSRTQELERLAELAAGAHQTAPPAAGAPYAGQDAALAPASPPLGMTDPGQDPGRRDAAPDASPPGLPPGEAPPALPPALPAPASEPAPLPAPVPPDTPPDLPGPAPGTAVSSQDALRQLLGRHALRLQWLAAVPAGTAEIVERDGALWLSGRQGDGANMLLVEGQVASVAEDGFVLRGRVVTRVGFLGGGQPCERRGELWFARKAGRPFWRMQSIASPCTGVSDYVDIAVEHEP